MTEEDRKRLVEETIAEVQEMTARLGQYPDTNHPDVTEENLLGFQSAAISYRLALIAGLSYPDGDPLPPYLMLDHWAETAMASQAMQMAEELMNSGLGAALVAMIDGPESPGPGQLH